MLGLVLPLAVYAVVLVLHVVLPGRRVTGYAVDPATGERLRYRLNGLLVFGLTVGLFVAAAEARWLPWDLFWRHRVTAAIGACVLGLVFTAWIVLGRGAAPGRGLLSDLYLGRLENPRVLGGRVDLKMFLYLVGATMLELNLVSSAAHHVLTHPAGPSPGVLLHTALFSFFLVDYMFFEEVHLYTYDLVAERVGFKLGWGCLVFYPFFYNVGLWSVADRDDLVTPPAVLVVAALLFLGGWTLSRGANLQKFLHKTRPGAALLGVLRPETLDGKILVSGFWGLARHINYLGEILMASGLALSFGLPGPLGAWLYPLFYVALLVPRERDDDRRCAAKYGPLWDDYRRRVPSRIVPHLY